MSALNLATQCAVTMHVSGRYMCIVAVLIQEISEADSPKQSIMHTLHRAQYVCNGCNLHKHVVGGY